MKPAEKAKELIERFAAEIGCSDFHIPQFISNVPCADGSKEYSDILENETLNLAKINALVCLDETIAELTDMCPTLPSEWKTFFIQRIEFYQSVKSSIENS